MSTLRGFIIAALITGMAAIAIFFLFSRPKIETPEVSTTPGDTPTQEQAVRSAPAFDIVRVDLGGTAIIAGTGEPGSAITIMVGDQVIAKAEVGADGSWSIIISDPLPVGDIELHLVTTTKDGQSIRSRNVVLVSIPPNRDRLPLVVLGSPGGASLVMQDPDRQPSSGSLVLETVDYDRQGGVIFAGVAKPGMAVRVFSDDILAGEARADENGRWVVISRDPISVGVHKLQIDQVEANGRVSAVLVLPFERADLKTIATAGAGSVIVQPGNSLWRIARKLYGSGWQYTVIYSANADQIQDPDKIYPGQVFAIPKISQEDP
ncbi:MAG: LysM peptidoglycan-binding domain-containing protein [Robiginitomaculum sp.]|nr:LysM peptidoglycan-binding domain-containing protein [Robiginitomaculum sp.]